MLKKKITSIGNSWGVIIPKAILDGLNINPVRDEVTIEIEPDGIKIKKQKRRELNLFFLIINLFAFLFQFNCCAVFCIFQYNSNFIQCNSNFIRNIPILFCTGLFANFNNFIHC